jgi:hypothetical protein
VEVENHCLFWEPYTAHKWTSWVKSRIFLVLKLVVHIATRRLLEGFTVTVHITASTQSNWKNIDSAFCSQTVSSYLWRFSTVQNFLRKKAAVFWQTSVTTHKHTRRHNRDDYTLNLYSYGNVQFQLTPTTPIFKNISLLKCLVFVLFCVYWFYVAVIRYIIVLFFVRFAVYFVLFIFLVFCVLFLLTYIVLFLFVFSVRTADIGWKPNCS